MTTLYRRATEPVLSAENVLSRFEEGKPADPTENMSPEDKAEWEKQNDLHKDEFKSAAFDEDHEEWEEAFTKAKEDIRRVLKRIQQLVGGQYREDRYDNNTVSGLSRTFLVENFGVLGPRRDGSWVSINIGVETPETTKSRMDAALTYPANTRLRDVGLEINSGKLWFEMLAGLEDSKGNRGRENVPGAPKGWFQPGRYKNVLTKAYKAFEMQWGQWRQQQTEESGQKTAAVDKAKVKKWMKSMVDDHVDNKTGEVNTTSLAESAAHEFDQDQWLDDENHWVWDLSFDVANGYERANKQASMNVATRFLTAGQDKQAPEQVDKYFKEVKEGNPSYSDSQAYATAWSIYCKHKNPGSESCHQDEYLTGKTASSPQELREMRELMESEGYDPDDAKNLQDEGMGAHELEHIFKTTRPGGMGSLEYTHGIRRLKTAGFRTAVAGEQDQTDWPDWLKKAKTKDAVVKINYDGTVIWKSGTWLDGTWEGGTWEGGIWKSGTWKRGTWKSGTWKSGDWEFGIWLRGVWENGSWSHGAWVDGTWKSGTWEDGVWSNGLWRGGDWMDGTWQGGDWMDGTWQDGLWEDGTWVDGSWHHGTWFNGVWEDGIWKDGSWKEGTWLNGEWRNGQWQSGIWEDGTWAIGTWLSGVWKGGEGKPAAAHGP